MGGRELMPVELLLKSNLPHGQWRFAGLLAVFWALVWEGNK